MARKRPFGLPPARYGKGYILAPDDSEKKKIEMDIAKKRYEIEVLQIHLKYPEKKDDGGQKIGFKAE